MPDEKISISVFLLREYTYPIRFYYVEHPDDELPDDLTVFYRAADTIRQDAARHGELEVLRLVIDTVLAHDDEFLEERFDMDLTELIDTEPAQLEETLKTILTYIRDQIWPDAGPIPPGGPPGVELIDMPPEAWRAQYKPHLQNT